MKYLYGLLIILAIAACDKKEIETWAGEHYVYFTTPEDVDPDDVSLADSIDISFFFYLEDKIQYPLEVGLTGKPFDEDVPFKVVVDEEKSNLPSDLYDLPEYFTFRKGRVKDTIYVTLKNDRLLLEQKYNLKLNIVSNDKVLTHKGKNASRLLLVSDIAVRPSWWVTDPIEWWYLGDYSRKKYELFMQVTGESQLDLNNLGKARLLTLQFQHWLDRQNPRIMEEDGKTPMTTRVIG